MAGLNMKSIAIHRQWVRFPESWSDSDDDVQYAVLRPGVQAVYYTKVNRAFAYEGGEVSGGYKASYSTGTTFFKAREINPATVAWDGNSHYIQPGRMAKIFGTAGAGYYHPEALVEGYEERQKESVVCYATKDGVRYSVHRTYTEDGSGAWTHYAVLLPVAGNGKRIIYFDSGPGAIGRPRTERLSKVKLADDFWPSPLTFVHHVNGDAIDWQKDRDTVANLEANGYDLDTITIWADDTVGKRERETTARAAQILAESTAMQNALIPDIMARLDPAIWYGSTFDRSHRLIKRRIVTTKYGLKPEIDVLLVFGPERGPNEYGLINNFMEDELPLISPNHKIACAGLTAHDIVERLNAIYASHQKIA